MRRRLAPLAASLVVAWLAGCAIRPSPPAAAQCLSTLAERGVVFAPAAVPSGTGGCGIVDPIGLERTTTAFNQPAIMSCGLAERLEAFEREIVQPAALRHLGRPIAAVRHLGAFACRREAGTRGRLSQHARGNAIDIAGFELADGSRVEVAADWQPPGPRREFLREIAKGACAYFAVVLTPASNADHHDHFHLDIGPWRSCKG